MLQTALQEGVAAASRVFGIIDKNIDQKEIENTQPLKVTKGEIVFEQVWFGYLPGQEILKNLSLTVPAGKTVALVGPSGAGKSTVLNLVLRFFAPQKGRILIDGQDICKHTIKSLRQSIAFVTQEPVLFDDSVNANIGYGTEDATDARIQEAARAAAAHEFVTALKEGYGTHVGEAGNSLSGGERQRLAIARALLKDAPILLLDEPTSSLDSEAEVRVREALERLMEGRTVLMIAHRLSTVKKADLIYVIDGGEIVEQGRHEKLLSLGGHYARLYQTQFDAPPGANFTDEVARAENAVVSEETTPG
jgi:subfamily B ATP-binding cassette protein MsbA